MRSTITWLGLLSGTLSVVMLMKHGFDFGFTAPLQMVLDYYEQGAKLLLGWLEPIAQQQLQTVGDTLGWREIHLYSHWKHILILMWLYFAADFKGAFAMKRYGVALFEATFGSAIALLSALGAGLSPIDSSALSISVAIFPVLGIAIYGLGDAAFRATFSRPEGRNWAEYFGSSANRSLLFGAVGLTAIMLAAIAEQNTQGAVPNPTLSLLLVLYLALASFWIAQGATRLSSNAPVQPSKSIWKTGGIGLGRRMLVVLAGGFLFAVLNAGLRLVGM